MSVQPVLSLAATADHGRMLNGGTVSWLHTSLCLLALELTFQLDGAHLEVTSASDAEPKSASVLPTGATGSTPLGAGITEPVSQEDKPKVGTG